MVTGAVDFNRSDHRAEWLASVEAIGHWPPEQVETLPLNDQVWFSAAHLYPLRDEAATHSDPLVAAMGELRLVQVRRQVSDFSAAVTAVASAFDEASPARRQTLGAAALLSVSRLALRLGAWELLGKVLPGALGIVRSSPQSRRLSVATGLVAEWALARADHRTACLYTSDSLYHGSERQRLRGYLGLAYAMAGSWDRARLLCEEAWSAQNLQAETAGRAPFGALNLIRVEALRAMAENSEVRLENARRRFGTYSRFFETSLSRIPILHGRLALALASTSINGMNCSDEVFAIGRALAEEGRWRDCTLIDGYEWPGREEALVIESVNACSDRFSLPSPWRIDFAAAALAGVGDRPVTETGLPTVLFCI